VADCENVFVDVDGDGEADGFDRVCDGIIVDSFDGRSQPGTLSPDAKSPVVDDSPLPVWASSLGWVVLIAVGVASCLSLIRTRRKRLADSNQIRNSAVAIHGTSTPMSNEMSAMSPAKRLICSTCGQDHGNKSDWAIAEIRCTCGRNINTLTGRPL